MDIPTIIFFLALLFSLLIITALIAQTNDKINGIAGPIMFFYIFVSALWSYLFHLLN
jgi:hypothetical protein